MSSQIVAPRERVSPRAVLSKAIESCPTCGWVLSPGLTACPVCLLALVRCQKCGHLVNENGCEHCAHIEELLDQDKLTNAIDAAIKTASDATGFEHPTIVLMTSDDYGGKYVCRIDCDGLDVVGNGIDAGEAVHAAHSEFVDAIYQRNLRNGQE